MRSTRQPVSRRELDAKLRRLFGLLAGVLTPAQLDDVTAFWGQSEWNLAIELAARLVAERRQPIEPALHDLLVELLAHTEHAGAYEAALAPLRTPTR